MKWLQFFRKRRKQEASGRSDAEDSGSASDDELEPNETGKDVSMAGQGRRRSEQQQRPDGTRPSCRPSLDQWFAARRARTSIDIAQTTTTEKLTVCKAGVTTLINRTYIVVKHLGSGTYGQVKLAFNIKDRKLYAIKSCRKSQYASFQGFGTGLASPRLVRLSRSRRNLTGVAAGMHGCLGGSKRAASGSPAEMVDTASAAAGGAAASPTAGRASLVSGQAPQQPAGAEDSASGSAGAATGSATAIIAPHTAHMRSHAHNNPAGTPVITLYPPSETATPMAVDVPLHPAPIGAQSTTAVPASRQTPQLQPQQDAQGQGQQGAQGSGTWQAAAATAAFTPGHRDALQGSSSAGDGSGSASGSGTVGRVRFGAHAGSSGGQVGAQRFLGASRYRYSSSAVGMGGTGMQAHGGAGTSAQGPPEPAPWGAPPPHVGGAPTRGLSQWRMRVGGGGGGSLGSTGNELTALSAGTSRTSSIETTSTQRRRAEEWMREIAIMKKLSHPNIVRLVEVIDDPASDALLLVMEYVEGITLHPKRLDSMTWERVPEAEAWRRTRDVLQGLDYLHYHGVVHGDLKPANLMLDTNTRQVKIVDFGSAVISHAGAGRPGGFTQPLVGGAMSCTPAFRSPESLQAGYKPNFELDIWALGVSVFMWVYGRLPFNGAAPFLIYESIKRKEFSIPTDTYSSQEVRDFLQSVLEKDPTKRLDIVGCLSHPWVTGNGEAPVPIIPREPASPAQAPASPSLARMSPTDPLAPGAAGALSATDRTDSGEGLVCAMKGLTHIGTDSGSEPSQRVTNSGARLKRNRPTTMRMVSQEELDLAISRSVGGMAITELMGMVFEEVHIDPRQQIIKAGDPVDTIYLITQGELEIYQELQAPEAAAVASLLGSSTQRSRIWATVLCTAQGRHQDSGGLPSDISGYKPASHDAVNISEAAHIGAAPPTVAITPGRTSFDMETDAQPQQQQPAPGDVAVAGGAAAAAAPSGVWTARAPSAADAAAAASHLAQPIISGLDSTRARALFMGPNLQGFQQYGGGARFGGLTGRGFHPRLVSPEEEAEHEEEETDEDTRDPFLTSLVTQLLPPGAAGGAGDPAQNTSSSGERTMGSHDTLGSGGLFLGGHHNQVGSPKGMNPGQRRKQLAYTHGSSTLRSSGLHAGDAPHVLILAMLGPGDTLGFSNMHTGHDSNNPNSHHTNPTAHAHGGGGVRNGFHGHSDGSGSDLGGGAVGLSGAGSSQMSAPTWAGGDAMDTQPPAAAPAFASATFASAGAPRRFASQQSMAAAAAAAAQDALNSQALHSSAASQEQGHAKTNAPHPPRPTTHAHKLPTWQANVRTRTPVVAFKASLSEIQRLSRAHPELEGAMKTIAVQQETDLLVSEALRQLRLVSATGPLRGSQRQAAAAAAQPPGPSAEMQLDPAALLPVAGGGGAGHGTASSGSSGGGSVLGANAPQAHHPSLVPRVQ